MMARPSTLRRGDVPLQWSLWQWGNDGEKTAVKDGGFLSFS